LFKISFAKSWLELLKKSNNKYIHIRRLGVFEAFLVPQFSSRSFFSGGDGLIAFMFGFLLGRSGFITTRFLILSEADLADDIPY